MSDNLARIFEMALREEGERHAIVLHTKTSTSDQFTVKKEINGETVSRSFEVTLREQEAWGNHTKQRMAEFAARIARMLHHAANERHEWGDNVVDIDMENDKATCLICGSQSSMSDISQMKFMSESSAPQPQMIGGRTISKHKKRFALLAMLRDSCEDWCENSPYDDMGDRKI